MELCVRGVLLGKKSSIHKSSSKVDRLVTSTYNWWTSAVTKVCQHKASKGHKDSALRVTSFQQVMDGHDDVRSQLAEVRRTHIEQSRQKLQSIVSTVLFCGMQNIPLRGHRDDSKCLDKGNAGNFQALLNFRVEGGDDVLKQHFDTASRNATYRSKTVQNEIIHCCDNELLKQIIDDMKQSIHFSVLADETQDASNMEQLTMVLQCQCH